MVDYQQIWYRICYSMMMTFEHTNFYHFNKEIKAFSLHSHPKNLNYFWYPVIDQSIRKVRVITRLALQTTQSQCGPFNLQIHAFSGLELNNFWSLLDDL